jgi:hypothetical protein
VVHEVAEAAPVVAAHGVVVQVADSAAGMVTSVTMSGRASGTDSEPTA